MQNVEEAIRERAYQLWLADGCQDGNQMAHWLEAQRELLASSLEQFGDVTATKARKSKKASAKRAKAA